MPIVLGTIRDAVCLQSKAPEVRGPLTDRQRATTIFASRGWSKRFLLPRPGYCFRSISLFVYIFLCFFVIKITRKRLDRFASNFQGRCGVTMARPDYIFGQFRETAPCLEAQQRDGVCCAFAPQFVRTYVENPTRCDYT